MSKGIHQVPPLNGRLSNLELVITIKNECVRSTDLGNVRVRDSKDWIPS